MGLDQFAPPRHKAFIFTEYLEEGNLEAHSCGNGRFIQGAPSTDVDICFSLYKTQSFLDIRIHEVNLLHWLRAIPSLRDDLGDDEFDASISMDLLLPCYPEMSAKFDQDKREGLSFDALDLFVHHFLREGSVFATFGLEHLHEKQTLTELHFHDIQNQDRSMSEDLDLLDEAIGEIDEQDVKKPSQSCFFMNEPLRSQLQAAIKGRDPIAVDKVLAMGLAFVDTKTLCLALRYYEWTVFDLLLKHAAQVGGDDVIAKLLYRAAKAGLMDAVQLLLTYDASKKGGDSCNSTTPLNGAASGGHLPIVQYLIEEKGANINGNEHQTPLARAIKYHHTHIVDYLLRAGANMLQNKYLMLLPQFLKAKQAELSAILERFIAGMCNGTRDRLLSRAVSEGNLEIVRCLVEAGVNVNPDTRHCASSEAFLKCNREHSSPLAVAASNGHLEIVRCLVAAGANVRCHRDSSTERIWGRRCARPRYSPLAAAAKSNRTEVAQFLISIGATLLQGEGNIYKSGGSYLLCRPMSVGESHRMIASKHSEAIDCPAVAAIQARQRKAMARRLLAKVANSCEKLLDAITMKNASAGLIAFVDQVGTSASVWRSGTRAIRDICGGYMPRRLSDIVSALQVANAMRLGVPRSRRLYSKKEFVNDIPRWAALLSPDDQGLFLEIASYLWGIPASTIAPEKADSSPGPLMLLQDLVSHLVRTYGLFQGGSGNSGGSYRLQSLRKQMHPSARRRTYTCEKRPTLAEWHPLPTQAAQESPYVIAHKPPDPEDEEFSILARITVLMAGAIFGAVLLYLCLSRHGFSTLRLPIPTSDAGQSWASDPIITRNNFILAMYIGLTSHIDFKSWESTDHLLSLPLLDSPPTERVREPMAALKSSYEGDSPMIDLSK
ncbi:hypothetical protein V8C35DRAFT_315454 [Trichoderma chlorosporum]